MIFLDVLLFAVVAVIMGYRLWRVLGTYNPDKPIKRFKTQNTEDSTNPVRSSTRSNKKSDSQETEDLDLSIKIDKNNFLKGAKIAFQQILEAYLKENLSTLKNLLARPVYESFVDAVQERKKKKHLLDIELIRILSAEIIDESKEKNTLYFTVKFVSEQCISMKDHKGNLIMGDPEKYSTITDIWTFSRDLTANDPNWILIATQVSEEKNPL